jgi:polyisoprenoid-binding protein YceI
MSTIATVTQSIPTGTWKLDPVHSSIGFAVRHMGTSLFRGTFADYAATLDEGILKGSAKVETVQVQDENLNGHLLSPEFFDAERYPEIRFESGALRREGDDFSADGVLEIKGVPKPVRLLGTIGGPVTDPYGNERLGLALEASIDRTEFGVSWNAELPGGGQVVENEVKLTADLELVKEG